MLDPATDPVVAAMDPKARAEVGRIWAHRAQSEARAGSAFTQVRREIAAAGAVPAVLDLAERAIADEAAHARTCHHLAEVYSGHPVELPNPQPASLPPHRGAPPELRPHLHLIGLSCVNETIAARFAALCLDHADAPTVRRAESRHLRDEILHARVGWAHLASGALDRSLIAQINRWLPRIVKANTLHWLARVRTLPAAGVPSHAYPPVPDLEAAVRSAVRTLVVPGFAAAGFDVTTVSRTAADL